MMIRLPSAAELRQCRSCGADVLWVRTGSGKPMPVDAKPNDKGNVAIVDGVAVYLSASAEKVTARYVSHFATCPDGRHWRKPR